MRRLAFTPIAGATAAVMVRLLHLRIGGWPTYIGLDPADGAMYVPDNVDAAVSVFPLPS